MKRILFVCTGNTCRSPMAEGMLAGMASRKHFPLDIRSAGLHAVDGTPVAEHTAHILQQKGYPAVSAANSLDKENVEWADLVLTMTMSHKRQLIQQYPEALEKTFTLKEYVASDAEHLPDIQERDRFLAEIEVKLALSQPLTEAEEQKWQQYQQQAADLDIHDPFGGSADVYRACAREIETHLEKLLQKLKREQ